MTKTWVAGRDGMGSAKILKAENHISVPSFSSLSSSHSLLMKPRYEQTNRWLEDASYFNHLESESFFVISFQLFLNHCQRSRK